MKKITKKSIIVVCVGVILTLIIAKIYYSIDESISSNYSATIVIQTIDNADVKKNFQIDLKEYGNYCIATPSFLNREVYMSDSGTYYLDNNRYKKIITRYTYRDLYRILSNQNKKDTHPKLNKKTINEILECLFINYEISSDAYANITFDKHNISSFAIYLEDVLNLKSVNIIINYSKLDSHHKSKEPIIYSEILDNVDTSALQILNR